MMKTTYKVEAIRSGEWWAITVPEVRGVHSQARRLNQLEDMAREAISLVLDVPEESVEVEVVPRLDPDMDDAVRWYRKARDEAARAASEAQVATVEAVELLERKMGLTVRDIGQIMGLSFQRVQQLTKGIHRAPS